ncbi:MAG: hypothetical protein RBQ79_01015 [Sphaerochaetaceae bacterium]|jgi:hypothetical protein|nr:hypothetical protein [Sphaerochaetaceae bacterium]
MGTEPPRLEKLIKDLREATETWEISKHRFQYGYQQMEQRQRRCRVRTGQFGWD